MKIDPKISETLEEIYRAFLRTLEALQEARNKGGEGEKRYYDEYIGELRELSADLYRLMGLMLADGVLNPEQTERFKTITKIRG